MLPSSWQKNLSLLRQNRFSRIAILGIGNPLRSDDAAGGLVARGLTQCRLLPDPDSVLVMDAGHAPENRTGELRRFHPDLVILIDAAEMGARPGDIRWLSIDEIDGMSASTHTMPLSMLARYLLMECGCEVKILGIQPGYTEYGEGMSGSVLQAVNEIVDGFVELWSPFPTHEYQSWN